MRVGVYGCIWCVWVYRYAITIKLDNMGTGGTWACMIWAPGWPGIFPEHHVRMYLGKNNKNEQQAHTAYVKARTNHYYNLMKANVNKPRPRTRVNGENERPE